MLFLSFKVTNRLNLKIYINSLLYSVMLIRQTRPAFRAAGGRGGRSHAQGRRQAVRGGAEGSSWRASPAAGKAEPTSALARVGDASRRCTGRRECLNPLTRPTIGSGAGGGARRLLNSVLGPYTQGTTRSQDEVQALWLVQTLIAILIKSHLE